MSFAKKGAVLAGASYFRILLGVAQVIILSRLLGPDGVGKLTLYRQVFVFAVQLSALGLPMALIHAVNRKKIDLSLMTMSISWFSFPLILLSSTTVAFLFYIAPEFFGSPGILIFAALFTYVTGSYYGNILNNVQASLRNARNLALLSTVPTMVFTLLIVITYCIGNVSVGIVTLFEAVSQGAVFLLLGILASRAVIKFSTPPSFLVVKDNLPFGIQIMFSDISYSLNSIVGILILRSLAGGFDEVGYYSRGLRLATLIILALDASSRLLYSHWAELSGDSLRNSVHRTINFCVFFSILASVGVLILAKPLVILLFGHEFLPAVTITRIMVPGVCVFCIMRMLQSLFSATGRVYLNIGLFSCGIVVNIVFGLLLVPYWNANGTAWAAVIANITMASLAIYFGKRLFQLEIKKMIIPSWSNFRDVILAIVRR